MESGHTLKKILVPIDGSAEADHALDYAMSLAKHFGAEISLIHAVHVSFIAIGEASVVSLGEELEKAGERLLSEREEKVRMAGMGVSKTLVKGPPAEAIIEAAKAQNVDLIVMGSRGLSRLKRVFLGSVSTRVSQNAHCSVLIARGRPFITSGEQG